MIPQPFEYTAPATLGEALSLIAAGAKPLAGGHSLIPLMKLRLAAPDRLVDLRRVPGLNFIREQDGSVQIGALTTHHDIESSALLRFKCPLLAETAAAIGDVQVRNAGTIGGSLAHADPAADYAAALFALEAKVHLVSANSGRFLPMDQFLTDTFTTALQTGEIILDLTVPAEAPGAGASYQKAAQPASGFAIVGVAARIRKTGGRIAMARVGVTGLCGKPYRATGVEKLLEGTAGSEDDIRRAAGQVDSGVEANSDLHASAAYRRRLAQVHTARAVRAALGLSPGGAR